MKHQVSEWMTRHPLKINPHEGIEVAEDLMHQEAIDHLLVFDDGLMVGVLSEKDLKLASRIRARFNDKNVHVKVAVGDLMSRHPVTITPSEHMSDAIRLMHAKQIHGLPVRNEEGQVVGILCQADVMRYALLASQNVDVTASFSKLMKGVVNI